MLALTAVSANEYMKKFLAGSEFDPFLVIEGTLSTHITYSFDGHINRDFYNETEKGADMLPYEFVSWSDLKPTIYNLVKGNHLPLFMKFVLQLKPEKAQAMLCKADPEGDFSQVKSLLLTIKYDGEKVILTSGISYNTFVMNHDADKIWDSSLKQYLNAKGLDFEEQF